MNIFIRISLIYSLAHLSIFALGDAIFWDDWLLFTPTAANVQHDFATLGLPWLGYLHVFMRSFGGLGYHLCMFISFLISSLLIYPILKFYKVDEKQAFWVAILLAVLPLNEARTAAIVVPYSLSCGLFFIGWYWMTRSSQWLVRLLSLATFFVSFSTESFLVYFALPLALQLFTETTNRSWAKTILRNIDFILLPIVFFVLKNIFFKPSGIYTNYNHVHLSNLLASFHYLSIMLLEIIDWQKPSASLAFIILTGIILLLCQSKSLITDAKNYIRRIESKLPLEVIGIIALLLALIPYYTVDRPPRYMDWDSRFQLLMPLGLALLIVGVISRVQREHTKPYALIILTISGVLLWNRCYADFYIDWLKQQSIIEGLKNNAALRDAKALLWVDETEEMDALHREYRMYDYNGLFNRAYGTQDHYVLAYNRYRYSGENWNEFVKGDSIFFCDGYIAKDVVNPTAPPQLVIISSRVHSARNHLSFATAMLFRKYFQPTLFKEKLKTLIDISGPIPLPVKTGK